VKKKNYSLIPVFIVVLTDLIGFGIVLPLLPYYGKVFGASAVLVGLLYSVYSFSQLIFSPLWGSYSDRIGRRPVMIISTIGSVIAYIIFGLAGSLWVLFLSRVIAGIMGGNVSTAQAYVADITTKENRSKGMGMIGAAFGIGFVIGPALATGLISHGFHHFVAVHGLPVFGHRMDAHKYAVPGFFAALLSFCSNMLVVFRLPETVNASSPQITSKKVTRSTVFSKKFWQKLVNQSGHDARGLLLPLFAAYFLLAFGQGSLYSAFPLFSRANLGLSVEQIGIQFFYIGLIVAFMQGGVVRYLAKRFEEGKIFIAGCILMSIGLALIPFADSMKMLSVYLGIMAVGFSLNQPTMLSLISQEAAEGNIGATMGTSQGMQGLGRVLGPIWGGFLFGIADGLPFYVTALVVAITIFIGLKIVRIRVEGKETEGKEPDSSAVNNSFLKESHS
jgi:DHA1 family tetracycline resistance protein-like MFS transporter